MLKDKSVFGRFPLIVKFSFRRKHIYLRPQGWGCWDSLSNMKYENGGYYKLTHFLIPTWYCFSWLWLDIKFTLRQDFQSEQKVYQEPVREVRGKEIV